MKIEVAEFQEGAQKAKGVTVIIDVFRAFSVAAYALDSGADRVIAVKTPEEAFLLKKLYKRSILAGETNERKTEGFDIGNSPTEILQTNLQGHTLIHCTTAGTKGLVLATGSSILLAGALVNVTATANYIGNLSAELVSLVAMGYRSVKRADEDILCARIISDKLSGVSRDYNEEINKLKNGAGKRFFEPENMLFSPPTDFFLCTMIDRFSFAIKAVRRDDGNIELSAV